jgi:hypothetical protein
MEQSSCHQAEWNKAVVTKTYLFDSKNLNVLKLHAKNKADLIGNDILCCHDLGYYHQPSGPAPKSTPSSESLSRFA